MKSETMFMYIHDIQEILDFNKNIDEILKFWIFISSSLEISNYLNFVGKFLTSFVTFKIIKRQIETSTNKAYNYLCDKYWEFISLTHNIFSLRSDTVTYVHDKIIKMIKKESFDINVLVNMINKAYIINKTSIERYIELSELLQKNCIIKDFSALSFNDLISDKKKMQSYVNDIKPGTVEYSIYEDNIINFIHLTIHHSVKSNGMYSLIELCSLYGSVNCFMFLVKNLVEITQKCLELSILGRNDEIIQQCLNKFKPNNECLVNIVKTHNYKLMDELYKNFSVYCDNIDVILEYSNLPAYFLLNPRNAFSNTPYFGYVPLIYEFLTFDNIDINQTDNYGRTAIINAVICKAELILKILINMKCELNIADNYGYTALIHCILNNDLSSLEILIQAGVDMNQPSRDGHYPIFLAIAQPNTQCAKFLIEHGCDVNVQGNDGRKAIDIAQVANIKNSLNESLKVKVEDFDEIGKIRSLIDSGFVNSSYTPLMYAIKMDLNKLAKTILNRNCDVNVQNYKGQTALIMAARDNNIDLAKLILEKDCKLDITDSKGFNALHHCVIKINIDMLKLLINANFDVNWETKTHETALTLACMHNRITIVSLLIENGANIFYRNQNLKVSLTIAAENFNIAIMKELIRHGYEKIDVKIALKYAVKYDALEIVEKLLDISSTGKSPLIKACRLGHIKAIRYLLDKKDDINKIDSDGMTPLMIAVQAQDIKMIGILMESNPNFGIVNRLGNNAFHMAIFNNLLDSVNELFIQGFATNITDKNGDPPLIFAIIHNRKEIFDNLLEWDIDLNQKGQFGKTALIVAAEIGNEYFVVNLIEEGCDINSIDESGKDALLAALIHFNYNIAEILFENGISLSAINNETGRTALHIVCDLNKLELAEKFAEEYPNAIEIKDKKGKTPIDIAISNKKFKLLKILVKNAAIFYNIPVSLYAYINFEEEFVRKIVEDIDKQDLNAPGPDGDSIFIKAIKSNNLALVEFLHENGAQIDKWKDKLQNSELLFAIYVGFIDIAMYLIRSGANIDVQNDSGITLLILAVFKNHYEIITLLLQKNCNMNIKDNDGLKFLHYAVLAGNKSTLSRICEKNANINIDAEDNNHDTPLNYALGKFDYNMAKELIKLGANVEHVGSNKITILETIVYTDKEDLISFALDNHLDLPFEIIKKALYVAIAHNQYPIVSLILSAKLKNYRNYISKELPIFKATYHQLFDVVKFMIDNGENINIFDRRNRTPLWYAIWFKNLKIIKLFVDHGCNLNDKFAGKSILDLAIETNYTDIINYLAPKFDCDNLKYILNEAFLNAVVDNNTETAIILLKSHADPNYKADDSNLYPIHIACMNVNLSIVKELVKYGCNIDIFAPDVNQPIFIAISRGLDDIGVFLIDSGCKLNILHDTLGKTPLMIAPDKKYYNLAATILDSPNCDVNFPDAWGDTALYNRPLCIPNFELHLVDIFAISASICICVLYAYRIPYACKFPYTYRNFMCIWISCAYGILCEYGNSYAYDFLICI